ncbi:alanine--tRNA ligase, partial [Candidatus Peregrinibacteria bacterium]|nr:alanine--tRNA ligase [Candidatus Peregrinibacteria bacterium]
MEAREIRKKYLEFFREKGHAAIPSAPLLPENDPTVLFTTAGMHPLVPFLLGEKHPMGKRLANFQKCVRTGDIDEVGDETHCTFFEMLGNWSLGDYFKKEAIGWSFEFLTGQKWLDIPKEKLAVSVFRGDADCPQDKEAAELWKSLGIPEHKIVYLPKANNWWGPAGQTGPCGPDTEMFYFVGKGLPSETSNPENDEQNWVEIWNDVFMQYNKTAEGKYEPLEQKNVDTGMGLERVAAVLQGKRSVYDTELFTPVVEKIETLATINYAKNPVSFRIIADHLRAATLMAGDGVKPGNVDQGYVMRRLIRRAIRHGKKIGIEQHFTAAIAKKVIHTLSDIYPELKHEEAILRVLSGEEERFRKTISHGLREFEKLVEKMVDSTVTGLEAFHLYDTYGFPIEMTEELAKEHSFKVDRKGFEEAFKKHQDLSRAGAEQKFKGGLQDQSEATTKLHTATHLLHAALHHMLGDHANQKGSNITAERLRFDFSHPEKLTPEQLKEIEDFVNKAIAADVKINCETLTVDEAKQGGAIGLFENKYGDKVKMYTIEGFSREICGGPHVEHTGQLGHFK